MSAEDWTPDRTQLLRQYRIVEGLSSGEIAKRINRETGARFSRNAVIGKLIRLGIEPPAEVKGKRKNQSKAQHAQARGKIAPPLVFAPVKARGAVRGPNSVRWIDHTSDQCEMFCAGEEGAQGFVCGEPSVFPGNWCKFCRGVVYLPPEKRRFAA